jgi:hypothetical protein
MISTQIILILLGTIAGGVHGYVTAKKDQEGKGTTL